MHTGNYPEAFAARTSGGRRQAYAALPGTAALWHADVLFCERYVEAAFLLHHTVPAAVRLQQAHVRHTRRLIVIAFEPPPLTVLLFQIHGV